ncbi:MAG: hypothetical protein WCV85_01920 [Patescibacteria group bacterium]|jgi:hypothetical protein
MEFIVAHWWVWILTLIIGVLSFFAIMFPGFLVMLGGTRKEMRFIEVCMAVSGAIVAISLILLILAGLHALQVL